MFFVVCFVDTNEVDVVPSEWLNIENGSCFWPPYKTTTRMNKAKLTSEMPNKKRLHLSAKLMYGPTGMFVVAFIILCVLVLNKQ